jgi:hypothetical protein
MDKIDAALMGMIVFFSVLLVFVDIRFNGEGEVFSTVATLLSNFSGALLMRLTGKIIPALGTQVPSTPANPSVNSSIEKGPANAQVPGKET